MTDNSNDPLHAPDCMQEETRLIEAVCPKCGKNLEFFSVAELRNQKTCYHCKQGLDTKAIANNLGISI